MLAKAIHLFQTDIKPDALLHNTQQGGSGTKVPVLGEGRSAISLSKIYITYSTKETTQQKQW